jgi:sugar phosphate isomerase/epimerase
MKPLACPQPGQSQGATDMHERLSVHAVCFPGATLHELTGFCRELGAQRVSLVSNVLLDEGLDAAQDALQTNNCSVESITHVFLPGRHLELGEESWRDARETLSRLIQHAKSLGARSIYMLTGGHGSLAWEDAAQAFRAAIAPCVIQAKAAGIPLMIENSAALYAEVHIAHSLRDAVTLAELADTGVCIDLFACWTEAGLRESIQRAMPRCHLVQVCDYVYGDRSLPSRAVPGDGAIPVERILKWMLEAGYAGTFDIELVGPRIDAEGSVAAVRRAAENLGRILRSLGV